MNKTDKIKKMAELVLAGPKRLVTNEMIEHWLFNDRTSDLKSNKE